MVSRNTEYSQVAQQVKSWPLEWRLSLVDELHHGLQTEAAELSCDWTETKNSRRCALIDKEIEGILTVAEQQELQHLQLQAVAFRDRVAPLPLQAATRLHQELLAKQHRNRG